MTDTRTTRTILFTIPITEPPYAQLLPQGKSETTFWMDFQIANRFGKKAIQDTYDKAITEWHDNLTYLIELTFALNYMCWDLYGKDNDLALLYADLYEKALDHAYTNLTGDKLTAFYQATD